jgi:predicted TIM-barrel enzyme
VEEPGAVQRVLDAAELEEGEDPAVLALAPAQIGFLDRWASDVEGARRRAQENLVTTVAALARAGVAAEARVGDEDIVQAVEDQLQSFEADEVVLVSGDAEEAAAAQRAASELEERLRARFRHVVLSGD